MGVQATPGPIHGSALLIPKVRPRRQIGVGAREVVVTRPHRDAPRRPATVKAMQPKPHPRRPALYATSFVLLFALSMMALGIGASVDSPRTLMSPADYLAGKKAIEATTRQALGNCRAFNGIDKEVCKAEARAAERVQRAELAARYHGTVAASADVRNARVKAGYDVARTRCNGLPGDDRVQCMSAAREERNRALALATPTAS